MKDLLRVGRFGSPFSSPKEPHCRDAVDPTYKTKYRVANWPAYNRALVRRGDMTVWLSSEAIAAWPASRSGHRGGQRRYSDLAIETALTLRLLYHLPLRQAEGCLHALFGIMRLDLSVPDYTTGISILAAWIWTLYTDLLPAPRDFFVTRSSSAALILQVRHQTRLAAYAAHPERFVEGPPRLETLPEAVWINPPAQSTGQKHLYDTELRTIF